jgi:hypothetical protein
MGKIGLVHLIYGSFFWIFGMDGLMGMAVGSSEEMIRLYEFNAVD